MISRLFTLRLAVAILAAKLWSLYLWSGTKYLELDSLRVVHLPDILLSLNSKPPNLLSLICISGRNFQSWTVPGVTLWLHASGRISATYVNVRRSVRPRYNIRWKYESVSILIIKISALVTSLADVLLTSSCIISHTTAATSMTVAALKQ